MATVVRCERGIRLPVHRLGFCLAGYARLQITHGLWGRKLPELPYFSLSATKRQSPNRVVAAKRQRDTLKILDLRAKRGEIGNETLRNPMRTRTAGPALRRWDATSSGARAIPRLTGSMDGFDQGQAVRFSKIRSSNSQRRTLVVIRKFSLTCSRPLRPSCAANSGWVRR